MFADLARVTVTGTAADGSEYRQVKNSAPTRGRESQHLRRGAGGHALG